MTSSRPALLLLLSLLGCASRRADPPPPARTETTPAPPTPAPPAPTPTPTPTPTPAPAPRRDCPPECFRAVECCAGGCGGPRVSQSCCPCNPGEVDAIQCPDRHCGGAPVAP